MYDSLRWTNYDINVDGATDCVTSTAHQASTTDHVFISPLLSSVATQPTCIPGYTYGSGLKLAVKCLLWSTVLLLLQKLGVKAGVQEVVNESKIRQKETAEQKRLSEMMIPKKNKRLYNKIMYSKKKKAQEVSTFVTFAVVVLVLPVQLWCPTDNQSVSAIWFNQYLSHRRYADLNQYLCVGVVDR